MKASYTKLRQGDWGIRCEGGVPQPGQKVTVTKKDGELKTETVDKVIWEGDGVCLCSIKANPPERGGRGCAACGRPGPLVEDMEDGLMKHWKCCDMPPH